LVKRSASLILESKFTAMSSGFATFTEEHEAFRRTVRQFVERELKPHVSQ